MRRSLAASDWNFPRAAPPGVRRRVRSGVACWLALSVGALACARGGRAPAATSVATPAPAPPAAADAAGPSLDQARDSLEHSRYAEAEAGFRALLEGDAAGEATLGLADVLAITGRKGQAKQLLEAWLEGRPSDAAAFAPATTRVARLLRAAGEPDAALARLEPLATRRDAPGARLLLGETLIAVGRRHEAEAPLMSLIDDYNSDRIDDDDADGLARVGRAAHLLRSPHDANDAFSAAERAEPGHVRTLLYRAELFLEKHDPGHAEEVLGELLSRAPRHPEALVWMAQVRLDQALDFDAARALANQALTVDPTLPRARFVLAGLALRDLELEAAEALLREGLAQAPNHLELLSLLGAVAFLGDDDEAFRRVERRVLAINPQYSRFYSIVGQYAEWEHRYDRIVELMREALAVDDEDAGAHAALGLNLIRSGRESAGVLSLRRAFAKDPFDVRVFNTLNLFEDVIPNGYVTKESGPFRIRYPKAEAPLLERYVPRLLEQAWGKFREFYGFEPVQPIGIDLFERRQDFAIRTSGLPQTAIQGVCFGKTLASLTPHLESFNLPMTLWHELAHVFHIQMSESHVPRWLTEGLAEYETIVERPEWRREHDPDLFRAWRGRHLPRVVEMNRAFSHARHVRDMATAYYASSQIAVFLVERFGRERLGDLLRRYARGERSAQALPAALGMDATAIEGEFDAFLRSSLSRYEQQFVPIVARRPLAELIDASGSAPGDAAAHADVASAALEARQLDVAKAAIERGLAIEADRPDLRFLEARVALVEERPADARAILEGLVAGNRDGYDVQMLLAESLRATGDMAGAERALESASRSDPSQSAPLQALWRLARGSDDAARELSLLERLVPLEQHEADLHRRLLELLVAEHRAADAVRHGTAAIYADLEGARTHALYAQALAQVGRHADARFEFESAILCPDRPPHLAAAHRAYADFLDQRGENARASRERQRAEELSKSEGGAPAPAPPRLSPP